jgi:predicted DNA-binding transcriptional regulator AlpA
LWRWQDNPELIFPRPIYIGRRRYWREAEIIAWLEAREVAS